VLEIAQLGDASEGISSIATTSEFSRELYATTRLVIGWLSDAVQNVWPAPSASSILRFDLASLHQRIRPLGLALAKMEIRAFRSS
jgi:hypothetical protein